MNVYRLYFRRKYESGVGLLPKTNGGAFTQKSAAIDGAAYVSLELPSRSDEKTLGQCYCDLGKLFFAKLFRAFRDI